MRTNTFWKQIEESFERLVGFEKSVISPVWQKNKLKFLGDNSQLDSYDEQNTKLAYCAIRERQQLLIIQPDYKLHRGAVLLASCIVIEGIKRIRENTRGGQVLYFGTTVGIREHLNNIEIGDLNLSTVFPQARVQRDLSKVKSNSDKLRSSNISSFNLPTLTCVYSPQDVITVCRKHKAIWIAVDCSESMDVKWLPKLLEYSQMTNIPLIAWTSNALSPIVNAFHEAGGNVFGWGNHKLEKKQPIQKDGIALESLEIIDHVEIKPIILDEVNEHVSSRLYEAYNLLLKETIQKHNVSMYRLEKAFFRLAWRYLRTIENLCVPNGFFNSEADNYWGISSLKQINTALAKYVYTLQNQNYDSSSACTAIFSHLESVVDNLERLEPPLWTTLTSLCVESTPFDTARIIVFPNKSLRQIFTLSLLAYFNFTEFDLRDLNIGFISLKELYELKTQNLVV